MGGSISHCRSSIGLGPSRFNPWRHRVKSGVFWRNEGSREATEQLRATGTGRGRPLGGLVAAQTYNYVWKTEASGAGKCRTIDMTVNDGGAQQAMFGFAP
jgi:hypothetical protein